MVELELLLDTIADRIITSTAVDQSLVLANQKTIRNGIISLGRTNADKLILFEKDVKANKEDLETSGEFSETTYTLQGIADILTENFDIIVEPAGEGVVITIDDGDGILDGWDITSLLTEVSTNEDGTSTVLNPINISQFVNIDLTSSSVVPGQANEFLDTNIYELLGGGRTRQDRIDDFFTEFGNLTDDPPIFLLENGMVGIDFSSDDYSDLYDISPTNPEGNIPRLDIDEGEDNISQTLQSLRDRLDTYLVDIDEELDTLDDQRPTYRNKSDGYLKFRNLNQGIIIRNTNQDFVEGLDPQTKDYLTTGFTITTWVRFLDKTSEGTLFNFGNPTRDTNPMGFKLETYVLEKDGDTGRTIDTNSDGTPEYATWGEYNDTGNLEKNYFQTTDTERFVRLIIMDDGTLRDSHVGVTARSKTTDVPGHTTNVDYDLGLMQTTHIPVDFNEWYFIVATFNPFVDEDSYVTAGTNFSGTNPAHSTCQSTICNQDPDFWRNNIDDSGYTHQSLEGNKCKVEIISRSDLLRARGYKG
jgi:hypothetical protein